VVVAQALLAQGSGDKYLKESGTPQSSRGTNRGGSGARQSSRAPLSPHYGESSSRGRDIQRVSPRTCLLCCSWTAQHSDLLPNDYLATELVY
jgi:hypothetical protein